MMRDQVYARAAVLAGELDPRGQAALEILCEAAFASLEARLLEGMAPEDCREAFVTAASFEAVAALEGLEDVAEIKAGDLTLKRRDRQSDRGRELRYQARALMRPYLKDSFLFAGV